MDRENRPESVHAEPFPYEVKARIGEGAMGQVYRAIEPELERSVAIKIMSKDMLNGLPIDAAAHLRLRFIQEARAAAALSHPSVTTIYRVGEYQGQPYIAMEWLDGEDLDTLMTRQPCPPIERALGWAEALAGALDAAHRAGVVHRDIKPANIMILRDDRLKVMDFGIAHLQEGALVKTQVGAIVGTPQYASPEQLAGEPLDGRADVFSSGVLLYQLFTGEMPFRGKTFFELTQSVMNHQPIPPRALRPAIPSLLEAIILKALAREPEARFQSAGEMAIALRAVSVESSVEAPPSPVLLELQSTQRPQTRGQETTPDQVPACAELSENIPEALAQVLIEWPARALPAGESRRVIGQVLEKPFHANHFAGALRVHDTFLLLFKGFIVAAFDPHAGLRGDDAIEALPEHAEYMTMFELPEGLDETLVPLLASLVNPRESRHEDLDAAFVNIPALAQTLAGESFTGVVRLERPGAFCLVLMIEGSAQLALVSASWGAIPLERSWPQWINDRGILVSVDLPAVQIANFCYRRALADYRLDVHFTKPEQARQASSHNSLNALTPATIAAVTASDPGASDSGLGHRFEVLQPVLTPASDEPRQTLDAVTGGDPMLRFAQWMLFDMPIFFTERRRIAPWKYHVGWVPLVRRVWLHHALPRPGSSERDVFDLVTSDDRGKVLHIAHRVPVGSPENFQRFVDRVVAAKRARIKTGDVGGACFIARRFEGDMLTAYREATHVGEQNTGRKWLFGLQKSLTGYEGFVRIGARRGFHLLLVLEQDGDFSPLLPDDT